MLSEDTGTQGKGNYELELGYDWIRQNGLSGFLFQPQWSYGTSPTLDLIVQPSWTRVETPDGQRNRGTGDTNLDAKWRFLGEAPWSLGIRAGLELPTAHDGLGLPGHKVSPHGILVITGDFAPLTINLNAGYALGPGGPDFRPNLYHFSAAATVASGERLFFVLDAALDSNADPNTTRYQAVGLAAMIYTIRPGLDLDIGYRGRFRPGAPAQQWLLGITGRGAL